MLYIISINIITGIVLLLLGYIIGERGGQRIVNYIFIINIISISYYWWRILIEGEERILNISHWFNDINKYIDINLILDKISIIMTSLILIITFIVMKYSHWYIPELKFIGYLYIFQVSMILLVSSRDFITIYFGWEWVGICSYLLINYWYNNISNNKAGIKAIFYNKIGDISLLFVIAYSIYLFNNHSLFPISSYYFPICIGLASLIKSAQYFGHPWLGDAMAGPTPVSALLHAATMVTAGIILLYRSLIIDSPIWDYLLYIGIVTIIFGGIVSLTQNDIKKIIAYSTCSQLGYMFFITIYNNIPYNYSLYHLFTHAYFKALLFLSAGIIIHYASFEQDIRRIKLSTNSLPYHLLLFSSLSLLSFPFTSGYYSKESILFSINNIFFFSLSILGAFLTILYSFKLLFKIFIPFKPLESKNQFPLPLYLLLLLLLFGCLFLGHFTSSYFLSSIYFISPHIPYLSLLPFFTLFIFFIFSKFTISYYYYPSFILSFFYSLFNHRTYFHSILNSISLSSLSSFYSLYLLLDKGILEYLGPLGIYRLFIRNNLYPISAFSNFNILLSFLLSLLPVLLLL
jgi:NADH:ubiquinone oxidoreductase subunit 5 (subunit L)/multisubunit Na+/H+ antiporter MnhA subunit